MNPLPTIWYQEFPGFAVYVEQLTEHHKYAMRSEDFENILGFMMRAHDVWTTDVFPKWWKMV